MKLCLYIQTKVTTQTLFLTDLQISEQWFCPSWNQDPNTKSGLSQRPSLPISQNRNPSILKPIHIQIRYQAGQLPKTVRLHEGVPNFAFSLHVFLFFSEVELMQKISLNLHHLSLPLAGWCLNIYLTAVNTVEWKFVWTAKYLLTLKFKILIRQLDK